MESSEDDAGAATNASRRASAREKDVGGGEGGGASDGMPPEPADPGAASETTSMSEEAFDADSVPDDVNTSTEAILDMIDEIVDGPDATRRRSYTSPDADGVSTAPADGAINPPPPSDPGTQTPSYPTPASVCSSLSDAVPQESANEPLAESEPQIIASTSEVCVEKVSPESVNNTNESCISALPTGVGPPTEVLHEALDNSAHQDSAKSNLLPVEVDTRPVAKEHLQKESLPCHEAVPEHGVSESVPNVAAVSEPCPEVLQTGDDIESVPKETVSAKHVPTPAPSAEQLDNACITESPAEVRNEILSQSSPPLARHPESPQASSSVTSNEPAESTSEQAHAQLQPEEPSNLSPSVPSSSVTEPVQVESDSSENQICERTIKCVTSSDNRDNVTVESAESTSESSSSSLREERLSPGETATRSPLRRRLVRPAPSDRRPDSTVSSSVDSSQSVHVDTTEQTSESVTKDVSSSSDAVTSVYCNIKPEEIRVSEISVCKAETSMNPPKKIKLVRQKSTSVPQRDNAPLVSISQESEQCQSTSSECTPTQQNTASSSRSGSQSEQPEKTPQLSNELVTEPTAHLQESSSEISDRTSQEHDPKPENVESISQPLATTESRNDLEKRVPPIKLTLSGSSSSECATLECKSEQLEPEVGVSRTDAQDTPDCAKQVPKLTIKLSSKQSEGPKSPIPKLTIKPIKPPPERDNLQKDGNDKKTSITKLNIKPIPKPAEKVNDIHRKSSSSEISESESSENDESNSMSDPATNSDQASEIVPKVTIKVGKPGTESEGKFYTEQNAPKLLIKGLQQSENEDIESKSKLKLVISQPEEKQHEKIPKLTIKTVSKSEGQPLSPKLKIKPIPPDSLVESTENPPIPKMKITAESFSSNAEVKENAHVPKITIKPVIKIDAESCSSKTPKKSAVVCDSPEHIPVVTKLNIKPVLKPLECEVNNLGDRAPAVPKLHIKPIIKPIDSGEKSEDSEGQIPVVSKLNIKPIIKPTETNEIIQSTEDIPVVSKLNIKPILKPTESGSSGGIDDKVPVVSKLNIKPIIKPKSNEVESSIEDIPKVTKLNIKPLRNPEEKSSKEKDCDVKKADTEDSIPVVMKLNIKPIVKPVDEDASKDSENQSSETGNSSDENTDHIPVVTKLNIKPIVKPIEQEHDTIKVMPNEDSIPVVTKLNIKPLVKPDECKSPASPKKDMKITKLNIKPVVKPDEIDEQKDKNEAEDGSVKNPPLLMKINIKNVADASANDCVISDSKKLNSIDEHKHLVNNVETSIPKITRLNIKPIVDPGLDKSKGISADTASVVVNCKESSSQSHQKNVLPKQNSVPDLHENAKLKEHAEKPKTLEEKIVLRSSSSIINVDVNKANDSLDDSSKKSKVNQPQRKAQSVHQNCTLLKKLLETKKDGLDKRLEDSTVTVNHTKTSEPDMTILQEALSPEQQSDLKVSSEFTANEENKDLRLNDVSVSEKVMSEHPSVESKDSAENLTKPLEISISDKLTNQSSGQDSPRIILKINKTDHGASAKIITEERPSTPQQNTVTENTQEIVNEKQSQKRVVNSKKKALPETPEVHVGKRLRSSRIVDEKTPVIKKHAGKRPPSTETSPVQNKVPELSAVTPIAQKTAAKRPPSTETSPTQNREPELSVLESKRLKLGQLLSNTSLTITTVPAKSASVSPTKPSETKHVPVKTVNHSLLNNENCAKNGNSKLHNILSNLQAKQAQALAFTEIKRAESISVTPELDSNTSTGSSDVVEVIVPIENDVITINDNSISQDLLAPAEEASQDPLEVEAVKPKEPSPSPVPLTTPQPKKRGRPRKLPLSEPAKQAAAAKPAPGPLPVPALEERPQRSLRLSRDRPAPTILAKPRGRGRGRGARRPDPPPREEPIVDTSNKFYIDESPVDEKPAEEIDPTSSRIKLPRMTEALDKLPTTPLSSRRRSSSTSIGDSKMFDSEPKVVLNILPKLEEAFGKSPETPTRGGRGGRGKRGGRGAQTPGRTPRAGRGRGRGGGRGMQYMKETMGIYGRVCGPATTTVQLFEEETCMMDDNATPAKSTHFDDDDSQSSVLSSTNDSSRMKKSKFADLFDSNKIWTAADVKEYMWPPPETTAAEHQVMMIQEQVAMFLGVKSFKRRYPELKRRAVAAEERDYVLSKGLVTESLCDLGITAVDASEVLDIMLSDYPHKYEEYRQHQRDRQRETDAAATQAAEVQLEDSKDQEMKKIEMKVEAKPDAKPEPPKVDLEKTRQEALAAAIASASEYNTRINALRRPAYVDLQTHTIHKRRPAPSRAAQHTRPPAGLYPHALLPGQYQHSYRTYTPEQLRYFPLNTVLAAPPPAPSPPPSSESEGEWTTSSSEDEDTSRHAKRKKLSKTKRSSQASASCKEEPRDEERVERAELCRACKLRLEANRKYTHERFLVCAHCKANLHPGCVELGADTIRKAREYAWQCAECKRCCACNNPQDHSKMLFCDLCDRGFHIYCVGLDSVPQGRWHCVECAVCKSCGAKEPGGPPEAATPGGSTEEVIWHHQTKRGPGGHKVYSHSLCTPCARAYRIGRYCPLCDRSFIGPKGTMQLVICKLCDRQHHQECVKQTVSLLNVLDYTCAECRRGGITSRSAAARLAPRTIATLFMAKRRFNKYAHRQYMQSRLAEKKSEEESVDVAEESVDVAEESVDVAEESVDAVDDESREVMPAVVAADDASDATDVGDAADVSDPLEGAGEPLDTAEPLHVSESPADETEAAVAALRMDFGD